MTELLSGVPWSVLIALGGALLSIAVTWGAIGRDLKRAVKDVEGLSSRLDGVEKALGDRLAAAEKAASERMIAVEKQAEANRMELAMYKLNVAETYVRATDMTKMEDRLAKRLDTLEHMMRNAMTQVLSIVNSNREARP